MHKYFFFIGQQFGTAAEVKERVHLHSIETRRELYLKKNDKERIRVQCKGTIPVYSTTDGPESQVDVGPSQTVGPSQVDGPSQTVGSSQKVK